MAAASAAARLVELPFEGVLDACGIAYSQCASNMQPLIEGATIKRFHAGFAARNGVISATLARHGLTGAHNWLEGRLGYYNLYEGGDYEPANLTTELGVRFELLGLAIKPWPSARDTHGAVEAALTLAGEHDIHVDEIASVEAFLVPNAFSLSGKPVGASQRTSGGRGDSQRGLLRGRVPVAPGAPIGGFYRGTGHRPRGGCVGSADTNQSDPRLRRSGAARPPRPSAPDEGRPNSGAAGRRVERSPLSVDDGGRDYGKVLPLLRLRGTSREQ